MNFSLHPQEIYLLERYISLDYFGALRDQWSAMINHVDVCLDRYMHDLPDNYRSWHLSDQPDIVWGERVLPNFRTTLQGLNEGFILLSHQDAQGLTCAWGVMSDHKGQMDYSVEWMAESEKETYEKLLRESVAHAHNISLTEGAMWRPKTLLSYGKERGPLNPPERWPKYKVNEKVHVVTGAKAKHSGIYVPDVKGSCAQFLSDRYDQSPAAKVCVGVRDIPDPITGKKWDEELILEQRSCTWYFVERCADQDILPPLIDNADVPQRQLAGEICAVSGFYFSPARSGSRTFFRAGEIFPGFDSAYGQTIWQWDTQG